MARVEGFEPGHSGQTPEDAIGDPVAAGVWGDSDVGVGVFGSSGALPPNSANVSIDSPAGVEGHSITNPGVSGRSIAGVGVQGESIEAMGILGRSASSSGLQGVTFAQTSGGGNSGVYGVSTAGGDGVVGFVGGADGVVGDSLRGTGVRGTAGAGDGVVGRSFGDPPGRRGAGVRGWSDTGVGVSGRSAKGDGTTGVSIGAGTGAVGLNFSTDAGSGVEGTSILGTGVWGVSFKGSAVRGLTYGDDPNVGAILGESSNGLAGLFRGNVRVTGTVTKAGGGFTVDHPLDPENKYLSHSFVESPDMLNVYSGTITTDSGGEARVELPDYFEAANQDFRYQLTALGQFAQAIVAEEIKENSFIIRTDLPRIKVSWQVTGVRNDAWAAANRISVEAEKTADDKGRYLHPELWGKQEAVDRGRAEGDGRLIRLIKDILPDQPDARIEEQLGALLRGGPSDAKELRSLLTEARRLTDETLAAGRAGLEEHGNRVEALVRGMRPPTPEESGQ